MKKKKTHQQRGRRNRQRGAELQRLAVNLAKEYELEAEDFFRNIWIRSIEIDGIELDAPVINEIEFEREGEIEIKFVPIRPGEYDFEIERLQSKGMVGKFIVK